MRMSGLFHMSISLFINRQEASKALKGGKQLLKFWKIGMNKQNLPFGLNHTSRLIPHISYVHRCWSSAGKLLLTT